VTGWSGRAGDDAAGPHPTRGGEPARRDSGMVTAEFAVALPAFVLVVLAALSGVAIVTADLRCADAAGVAARMAARGDSPDLTREVASRAAPRGAALEVNRSGGFVTATVVSRLAFPGLSHLIPAVVVAQTQVAASESSS